MINIYVAASYLQVQISSHVKIDLQYRTMPGDIGSPNQPQTPFYVTH
jgi:hypothetical protein